MPRETSLDRAIARLMRAAGAHGFKTHGSAYGRRGIPDVVGAYRGRALAIEVKRPGGKATPLQHRELALAAQAGAAAIVADSADAVAALLDTIDQETA
jgi:Holliday junction resolvase